MVTRGRSTVPAFVRRTDDASRLDWFELDSTSVDEPGRIESHINPYQTTSEQAAAQGSSCAKEDAGSQPAQDASKIGATRADDTRATALKTLESQKAISVQPLRFVPNPNLPQRVGKQVLPPRDRTVIRLPSYEQVKSDAVLYAHANRVLHLETNPGNARALVQAHGEGATARDVWITPPPIPLTTAEMDLVFDLPYARAPHPSYADENGSHDHGTKIPAWEMIRFSVNIMRGCFGG